MRLLGVVVVGVVLGALTSLGQQHLPPAVSSLANSAGSWTLAAFALTLLARRAWTAALLGVVVFVSLLLGYELASQVRLGFGMATGTQLFWVACSVVVGPVLGLLGAWARRDPGTGRSVTTGAITGVLVGEGVYGLTVIGDSTSPVYWWISIGAGVVGLLAWGWWRRGVLQPALATGTTGLVAVAFLGVYLTV